nr:MAG TPA: hypothetical protein [Caudoviricetes sp.]
MQFISLRLNSTRGAIATPRLFFDIFSMFMFIK